MPHIDIVTPHPFLKDRAFVTLTIPFKKVLKGDTFDSDRRSEGHVEAMCDYANCTCHGGVHKDRTEHVHVRQITDEHGERGHGEWFVCIYRDDEVQVRRMVDNDQLRELFDEFGSPQARDLGPQPH